MQGMIDKIWHGAQKYIPGERFGNLNWSSVTYPPTGFYWPHVWPLAIKVRGATLVEYAPHSPTKYTKVVR